jgi:hypothetical protein
MWSASCLSSFTHERRNLHYPLNERRGGSQHQGGCLQRRGNWLLLGIELPFHGCQASNLVTMLTELCKLRGGIYLYRACHYTLTSFPIIHLSQCSDLAITYFFFFFCNGYVLHYALVSDSSSSILLQPLKLHMNSTALCVMVQLMHLFVIKH